MAHAGGRSHGEKRPDTQGLIGDGFPSRGVLPLTSDWLITSLGSLVNACRERAREQAASGPKAG